MQVEKGKYGPFFTQIVFVMKGDDGYNNGTTRLMNPQETGAETRVFAATAISYQEQVLGHFDCPG